MTLTRRQRFWSFVVVPWSLCAIALAYIGWPAPDDVRQIDVYLRMRRANALKLEDFVDKVAERYGGTRVTEQPKTVEPEQPKTLAQRIRARFPGVYDDLSDQELDNRARAKYSEVFGRIPGTPSRAGAGDPVRTMLEAVSTTNQVRTAAWDAFYQSANGKALAERLKEIPLPPGATAQLLKLKQFDDLLALVAEPLKPQTTVVNGRTLTFVVDATPEDVRRVKDDYVSAFRAQLRSARMRFIATIAGLWVVPPIGLYVFGWGPGWVRRAFRQP